MVHARYFWLTFCEYWLFRWDVLLVGEESMGSAVVMSFVEG
jgi:hypothetical protein